ncbi:MAG: RNA-binding S4 domain-containing protein [Burkholderiales bacterium]|nr:RNA-binding S4 domain-containing protein [Burkholderiales bacterium]
MTDKLRVDKWLWAARFYKTRSLAADDIDKGRVQVDEVTAKPSRELKVGDRVDVRQGALIRTVVVQAISPTRGPASVAQALYQETAESVARRERFAEQRRLQPEPALSIDEGRPTKRDRRQLADWTRWSAKADD